MRKLLFEELIERRLPAEGADAAGRHPVVAVLENIRSLYNVGSCFRTADAMRLEQLVLTGFTSTPPRPEILKTALGAVDTVPWQYAPDAGDAIDRLRRHGHRIYAVELTETSRRIDLIDVVRFPVTLVFGNELTGIRQETLDRCDEAIEIPMYGVKHSLNVAVAFGIATWEMVRRVEAPRER